MSAEEIHCIKGDGSLFFSLDVDPSTGATEVWLYDGDPNDLDFADCLIPLGKARSRKAALAKARARFDRAFTALGAIK